MAGCLGVRGRLIGLILVVGASTLGAGCDVRSDISVMYQMHMVTESDEAPAGMGCSELGPGESGMGTGDLTADFWQAERTTRDGHYVRIGSESETLVDRVYDRDFLESREVDRFLVTTHSGAQYSFMYWGGPDCEHCPPIEFESLPGDPWNCGVVLGSESTIRN